MHKVAGTEKLKILLVVHVFFPKHFYGTETYTLELGKCLKNFGHNVEILTAVPFGEDGPGEPYSIYEYDGLKVHCIDFNFFPHNRFKQTYYRPELYNILRDILVGIEPDIIHVTHLINFTGTLLEVIRDINIPAVSTLTDFFGICFNNRLEKFDGTLCLGPDSHCFNCLACYVKTLGDKFPLGKISRIAQNNNALLLLLSRFLVGATKLPKLRKGVVAGHVLDITRRVHTLKALYGAYSMMIAPTDFLYEAYRRNYFYPEKLRKINFGIHLDLVKDFSRSRKTKRNGIRFGYIGQMTEHKGVDLLVKAYSGLQGRKRSLFLYGPFDQDRCFVEKLRRLCRGVSNIDFRGTFPREELGKRLSELDVLVIPSRWYENSPLVLLYALASGTPVIVSDVEGMSEFVKEGVNGMLFPRGDVKSLRFKMQKLLDNTSLLDNLAGNADYSKDVTDHAEEVLQIYQEVLARERHRKYK